MKTKISKVMLLLMTVVLGEVFQSCEDYGLKPPPAPPKICGSVEFHGSFPHNTQYCYVVLARDVPPDSTLDIAYLGAYAEIQKPDTADTHYTSSFVMHPDTGTFKWMFVAIIGNPDSVSGRNIVATYISPDDTTRGPIRLKYGDSIWVHIEAFIYGLQIP